MAKLKADIASSSNELITAIEEQTKQLLLKAENIIADKENNCSYHFEVNGDIKSLCKSFGSICESSILPEECRVTGLDTLKAVVDEACYFDLHLHNMYTDDIIINIRLVCNNTNSYTLGEKIQENEDTIMCRFTPLEPGKHKLHVKVFNKDIRGSPFSINVSMPLRMRCIPEVVLNGVTKKIGGIAIGPHNELAVIDSGGAGYNTVHVYNSNLDLMLSFGGWGSGHGQCYYPTGVVFDNNGNILVTDTYNHRIHKYNRQGQIIKTVGEKGRGKLHFSRPTGISINKSGEIYVCDRDNNRIQILYPNLEYKSEFGQVGSANDQLINPWDIAFDSRGDVYVVDAGHTCIKRFAPHGMFQKKIGPKMNQTESLKSPQMICIDKYDYIFVTEYERNEVVIFDTEGTYHTSFGCYGGSKGQFYQPRGIAKTDDDKIYVGDPGNCRLQIFH